MPDIPAVGERLEGQPVDIRHGDDRITRASTGEVCHHFGYYSPEQVAMRKAWAEILASELPTMLGRSYPR